MKREFTWIVTLMVVPCFLFAQQKNYEISIQKDPAQHKIIILADNKPFTEFFYPDSLEKPVLYPIYAPDGQLITRGFPLSPRPGEPTDHPHHIGLWFNYENVNGLDFWNNSFAIPADKKKAYGWIKTKKITQATGGNKGIVQYTADWVDQQNNVLLTETTTLIFKANEQERIIDRITTLDAVQDVHFNDAKDGLLGLRMAHELELPSSQPKTFTDAKGNVTKVAADLTVTGNYLTSEGKQGDSAWGTRAAWCLLYGKKKEDTISIAIIDHPSNPGYPTYWHARGYGLFAANPLGQKIFSNGKQVFGFQLKKGEKATFSYRIVIASGKGRMTAAHIEKLSAAFTTNGK